MSKIKNGGFDHDAEPFEQQQFGTADIEGVNTFYSATVKEAGKWKTHW